MARQYDLPSSFPPIGILAPAADTSARTSSYRTLKGAEKAWLVCRVNQTNAATQQFIPLQAQDVSGTGSKAINATRIWLTNDNSTTDVLTAQTAAASFTTDATTKDKLVVFEIVPETALDIANGFKTIAISTNGSNSANITAAELVVWQRYQGADKISTLAN